MASATFTKRRNYKNGGASYSMAGVRGSVYISGGVFAGDAPATFEINLGSQDVAFAAPSLSAERKAQAAERKAQRETARVEKAAAKAAEREAAKQARLDAKAAKQAAREQAKAAKQAAKQAAQDAAQ